MIIVMLKPNFPWKSTFEKLVSMEKFILIESYIFWSLHRNQKSMLKYSNMQHKTQKEGKKCLHSILYTIQNNVPNFFFIKFGTKINSISTLILSQEDFNHPNVQSEKVETLLLIQNRQKREGGGLNLYGNVCQRTKNQKPICRHFSAHPTKNCIHQHDLGCGVSIQGSQNRADFCRKVTRFKGNFLKF